MALGQILYIPPTSLGLYPLVIQRDGGWGRHSCKGRHFEGDMQI